MTTQQFLAFTVIGLMMTAFVWGRIRYDIVAMCSLLGAIALGVVPFQAAFSGFSDEIVIIVGSALVVSAGVARSGLVEAAVQRFVPVSCRPSHAVARPFLIASVPRTY